MGVFIESLNVYKELSTAPVNWALVNKKDRIRIEIAFNVKTYAIASTSNTWIAENTDGYLGTHWLTSDLPDFQEIRIGDTIQIYDVSAAANQTFTVTDKLSNSEIQLNTAYLATTAVHDISLNNHYISVTTPITAIKYNWNFKENDASTDYFSYIDGSEQMLVVREIAAGTPGTIDMEFLGALDYQLGSATAEGIALSSTSVYTSRFKIIHHTIVDAVTLHSQYDNYLAGISEPYFLNLKCLKFLYKIQAAYVYTDPNWFQVFEDDETLGNSGDFNENFNTGLTNYSSSIAYQDITPVSIPALELTPDEQSFIITIDNTTDSPFSATNTKIVLGFEKVPSAASEYRNDNGTGTTNRTAYQNFVLDFLKQTEGAASINGDNYGTGYQVFKSVEVLFVSASQLLISGSIIFGSDALARLEESDSPRYIISVQVQDHTLDTDSSDLVTLKSDQQEFYSNTSTPGLIVNAKSFLRHPDFDFTTQSITDLVVFPEDNIACQNLFYIDRAAYPTQEIVLKTIRSRYKVKNTSTLEEFTLDGYSANVGTSLIVGGYQQINISVDRPYLIPSGEPQKKIIIRRRSDIDDSDKKWFEMIMPTIIGWEYWQVLSGANTDFYDTGEPNNGLNKDWFHYNYLLPNWNIYEELKVTFEVDGVLNTYIDEKQIQVKYYNEGAIKPWVLNWIKFYDINDNLLFDAINNRWLLLGYTQFKIVAEFENGSARDAANLSTEFKFEVFEEGGATGSWRYSSSNNTPDADTIFRSINNDELIDDVYVSGMSSDKVTATALIEGTLMPNKFKFKASARIYDYERIDGSFEKITEDGEVKVTEDLIIKVTE